jgi:hypothetical protein
MTELILVNYGLWSSRNIEKTSKHNLGVNIVPLKKKSWFGMGSIHFVTPVMLGI